VKRWIPILFSTQFYLVVGKGKSRWVPLQRGGAQTFGIAWGGAVVLRAGQQHTFLVAVEN
jgi:hypothetical protein